MVKCDNCGITIPEGMESCPNCGKPSSIKTDEDQEFKPDENQKTESNESQEFKTEENQEFKPDENQKAKSDESQEFKTEENQELKSEEEQNSSEQKVTRTCKNCGARIYSDNIICPLCGKKLIEEENPNNENEVEYDTKTKEKSDATLGNKINLRGIIIPTITALILSIILSAIGIWMEDFYYSYVIAIIISVGFCAATIDNEINAAISGFIVGLILGMLETSIVELVYGSFVAGLYAYYAGNHTLILILSGVLVAFFSNILLKKPVTNIVTKIKKMM